MLVTTDKRDTRHCPKCNGEFPAQNEGRRQLIIDTVRANQDDVIEILSMLSHGYPQAVKLVLDGMKATDRDALLLPGGILTNEQIEALSDE